ncbi:MAG: hypothetical protein QOE90_484 [Thermoplasmata archaeon]|jgi:hypothetical protein|nr:hypothetical protein [Thermoplasmata archaeon]
MSACLRRIAAHVGALGLVAVAGFVAFLLLLGTRGAIHLGASPVACFGPVTDAATGGACATDEDALLTLPPLAAGILATLGLVRRAPRLGTWLPAALSWTPWALWHLGTRGFAHVGALVGVAEVALGCCLAAALVAAAPSKSF